MRANINAVLFEFDPICNRCKHNQNEDGSDSSIQVRVIDIIESGNPICQECDLDLFIENECEVTV